MTATQEDTIAELERTIAELRRERDAAQARRNSEYGERIEQQAAAIEVLKAMSATAGDVQPVLDLIARRARELCDAETVGIFSFDGELISVRCVDAIDMRSLEPYLRTFPRVPARDYTIGRAILGRQVIEIDDADADANLAAVVHQHRNRSIITLPFLVDDRVVGGMSIAIRKPGGLADSQKALARTLAEQAAIAIGSAETFRALQTRTADLQESLEYQTATSDVLKVISGSDFDLEPVFQAVVETAARLCRADHAIIYRCQDDEYRWAAGTSVPPDYERIERDFRARPGTGTLVGRVALARRTVQIVDAWTDPLYEIKDDARVGEIRTMLGVPLMRDGASIGVIALARRRVEPFTERQIELVGTFADQAVIAIENTRLLTEQQEALERQTATAEVLQVINASPGNLTPVFDAMLEKAMRLCTADFGYLLSYDGERFQTVAHHGLPPRFAEYLPRMDQPGQTGAYARIVGGAPLAHVTDLMDGDVYRTSPLRQALVDLGGARTGLIVALRKEDSLLGIFTIYRQEVRAFTDKQIALLQNFAAQAVIAMENARLINEQREALEQQTATAEVLQVINASPGDLAPVFDAMLEKAMRLCEAAHGALQLYDGERFWPSRAWGIPGLTLRPSDATPHEPGSALRRIVDGDDVVHIPDVMDTDAYRRGPPLRVRFFESIGARTALWVALRKGEALLGVFVMYRQEVQPFTDKQIALLQNFAAQAVIAMESARLLHELRARTDELAQRQTELRITFENMADGVAMFDETQHLVAWNRRFQDILDVPDAIIARRPTFQEYVRYLAERGEYGLEADPEDQVRRLTEQADQFRAYERARPDGRVIEIRHNPVPSGGFVLIYADITERKRNEAEIHAARDAAEEASRTIEAAFRELKTAQANLIQAEKMASLGLLTAGIAHEIKNPLNFVNNFAALSVDLLGELQETAAPGFAALTDDQRAEIEDVAATLTSNLQKITEHGKRADGIVKAMLEHSRGSSGERRMVDLNAVIDEALNLAYHGARAQDQSFNITLERDFGETIAPIEVNPQDMTRVFLNIFGNGFYAATRRVRSGGDAGFLPMLKVTTRDAGEAVEIRVRDNGTGIPPNIRDKLFQPFFTTKPTGEGTGLGLSITYDIVTQQHGGSIAVDSRVGEYSEFTIRLPRTIALDPAAR